MKKILIAIFILCSVQSFGQATFRIKDSTLRFMTGTLTSKVPQFVRPMYGQEFSRNNSSTLKMLVLDTARAALGLKAWYWQDIPSGGGGGSAGRLFKSLNANTTASGNTGSGEDNLMTYTIPADTLNTNGDQIDFTMTFTFAANANSKRVKLYYGATTIFDSGSQNQNSGSMEIRGTIVRTGATTQLISFSQNNDASSFTIRSGYTTAAETLSSTVVLKATGEGSADNDIQQILLIVKMTPNS